MNCIGLAIGINDYPAGCELAGCVNDAVEWADVFSRVSCSMGRLLDRDATRDNVLSGISDSLAKLNRGDWLLVSFSGHGTWVPDLSGDEPDGRDECLVPIDGVESVNALIRDDELHELLGQRAAGSYVFLATDSCHSGTVTRSLGARRRFLDPQRLPLSAAAKRRARRLLRAPRRPRLRVARGVVHLAACGDAEYAYDAEFDGRPNGALTRYALDALDRLRVPTFDNWRRSIRRRLPSVEYPQTPGLEATASARRLRIPFAT